MKGRLWPNWRTCDTSNAHNYAGDADVEYAVRKRHVLVRGTPTQLTVGSYFDGQSVQLGLAQLKSYAQVAHAVLERFTN